MDFWTGNLNVFFPPITNLMLCIIYLLSHVPVINCIKGGGAGTGVQASPLPLQRLQLEESYNGSPMSQRSTLRRESHVLADISEVESTCGTVVAAAANSTEQSLQNVAAMFPTVEESHIRDLLKKYLKKY